MFRKKEYRDLEKWRKTANAYRKRYYGKTATYKKIPWEKWQDKIVLAHEMTDHEISKLVGHSVEAIQVRRNRLKKQKLKEEKEHGITNQRTGDSREN